MRYGLHENPAIRGWGGLHQSAARVDTELQTELGVNEDRKPTQKEDDD